MLGRQAVEVFAARGRQRGAGDYVIVKPGEYAGMNITTDGKADARITSTDGRVTINDPNPENNLDGINLEGADFVTVEGFTVVGMPRAAFAACSTRGRDSRQCGRRQRMVGHSHRLELRSAVENNVASRSPPRARHLHLKQLGRRRCEEQHRLRQSLHGIQFNADGYLPGDGVHSRNVVEGNVIYDNGSGGGAAINLDGFQDGVVRNNLLYNNHGTGLVLYVGFAADSSVNNLVANNTWLWPRTRGGRSCCERQQWQHAGEQHLPEPESRIAVALPWNTAASRSCPITTSSKIRSKSTAPTRTRRMAGLHRRTRRPLAVCRCGRPVRESRRRRLPPEGDAAAVNAGAPLYAPSTDLYGNPRVGDVTWAPLSKATSPRRSSSSGATTSPTKRRHGRW